MFVTVNKKILFQKKLAFSLNVRVKSLPKSESSCKNISCKFRAKKCVFSLPNHMPFLLFCWPKKKQLGIFEQNMLKNPRSFVPADELKKQAQCNKKPWKGGTLSTVIWARPGLSQKCQWGELRIWPQIQLCANEFEPANYSAFFAARTFSLYKNQIVQDGLNLQYNSGSVHFRQFSHL